MSLDLWPHLGSLGRMIQVPGTASETASAEERYVFQTTVEGRRRAQVLPASPRSWEVSLPFATGPRLAALDAFARGAWGPGPWNWVTVQAQTGNLLTPREALLLDRFAASSLSDAGPTRVSDGSWAPRSLDVDLASGWVWVTPRGIPVVSDRSVTWAADVEGSSPQIQMSFYDAAGTQLAAHVSSAGGAGMTRVAISAAPPPGAVSVRVGARSSVSRLARPQVTWTSAPVAWAPGHGCPSAVLVGLSTSLTVVRRSGPLGSASFTVMEVA
ncbi:hypothetical protein [Brachybacterium phenoliresistens]|uniref:hypothetical protein n=1 Tax=Brachybacterium phenoliresistens TaxID=396014 RepID=UPI0031D8E4F6